MKIHPLAPAAELKSLPSSHDGLADAKPGAASENTIQSEAERKPLGRVFIKGFALP